MPLAPFENPAGFGAADFLEIAFAAVLIAFALAWKPYLAPLCAKVSRRTAISIAILACAPVALRLALLADHPVPRPDLYDEFSHLLAADTLRHFRLANPVHPFHRFFETFFVLQQPSYSSIYPLGQGIALAIGRAIFGTPWAGVLLASAAFCGLCYWMLRAWTTPLWALCGGIIAILEFGPLNPWMNNFWGGAFAAAAGCLVFGALPRLPSLRAAILLGTGLGLCLLIRPYESIFLFLSVAVYLLRRVNAKAIAAASITLAPFLGLIALHNQRVTGSWTTLPYSLSQYQYGVPASLTFQPDPVPHRELTPQQASEYQAQLAFKTDRPETWLSYLLRLEYRVRFYRFFLLAPLFIPLLFFLPCVREFRFAWVLGTVVVYALGINFFPLFQFHYLAPVACLFVLMAITGLDRMPRESAALILLLCIFQFGFWYAMHVLDGRQISLEARQFELWRGLNHANAERRRLVDGELEKIPGKVLVFVRYSPRHRFQDEWVYNQADIDDARIVWARDLGPDQDRLLREYCSGRTALLLEPDQSPPRLTPYY